jgi:hypothetical protein
MAEETLASLSASGRHVARRLSLVFFALVFACASHAAAPKKNPSWAELTPAQQQTLQPLAGEWDTLDAARRVKWIGIAKRYPAMSEIEQKRVQTRMSDWVKLTPDQRRVAREQFRKIGKLPTARREVVTQQWEEYQQLPADVKKNLAAETKKKTEKIEPRSRAKTAQAKKQKPPAVTAPVAPAPALSSVVPTSLN